MKTIVTHIGPDLDAIASIWLVKSYFPGWNEAELAFVPAGTTLGKLPPDDNPDVIHVDTGFGKYDHHQSDSDTCAALLVYRDIIKLRRGNRALERMTAVINDVDHFREVFYPNPTADFWNFSLMTQIDGWRLLYADNPITIVSLGIEALDGIYASFQNIIRAEKEIADNAVHFQSPWGKAFGIETANDEVVHLGQKTGFTLVIRRDPKKGYVRIKALPKDDIDLSAVYTTLKKKDPNATWFLHAGRHMILNGSSKNPDMVPTTLTLSELIDTVKIP
jgi:hypothetical protein